jgi:hypothetical protein
MATRTEDLTAQATGSATMFVTGQSFLPGTLEVHLNGVRQRHGVFFTENGTTAFETTEPPNINDTLLVQYETVGTGDTLVFPTITPSGIRPGRP